MKLDGETNALKQASHTTSGEALLKEVKWELTRINFKAVEPSIATNRSTADAISKEDLQTSQCRQSDLRQHCQLSLLNHSTVRNENLKSTLCSSVLLKSCNELEILLMIDKESGNRNKELEKEDKELRAGGGRRVKRFGQPTHSYRHRVRRRQS